MTKLLDFLKIFLGNCLKIALTLLGIWLFLFECYLLTMFVDWRIIAAALPFALVFLVLLIGWCMPAGKVQKRIFLTGGCLALAVTVGMCSMIGVNLYENAITIHDTVSGDIRYPAKYLPFDDDSDIARLPGAASERFTLTDAPVLLTSSDIYPLTAAFVNAVYPETEHEYDYEFPYLGVNRAPSFLLEGKYDVCIDRAQSAGGWLDEEIDQTQTQSTVIGRDAVVLYTREDSGVTGLTSEEVTGILTGKIANWKDVGGNDTKIKLFTKHDLSSAADLLEDYIGAPLADGETRWQFVFPYFSFARYTMEYRDVRGALGFTFLSQIDGQYEDVRFLAVNGVTADEESVQDGSYPITEDIIALTRAERSAEETRLISWILSDEGQTLVRESGFVPVNPVK